MEKALKYTCTQKWLICFGITAIYNNESQQNLDFKSQYTLRMYELLNKVKKQDYPEFKLTLEQANKMFDTKYERLVDIERYIIKVAQKN